MRRKDWGDRVTKRYDFSIAYFKYGNQSDPVIALLRTLPWLPVLLRVKSQILTMANKAVRDLDLDTSLTSFLTICSWFSLFQPLSLCCSLASPPNREVSGQSIWTSCSLFLKCSSPNYQYSIVLVSFKCLLVCEYIWTTLSNTTIHFPWQSLFCLLNFSPITFIVTDIEDIHINTEI